MKTAVLVVGLSLALAGAAQAQDSLNCRERGYYHTSGEACGVAVAGSFAYVADWNAGLRVIDVSNPANPVERGYYVTPGLARGVSVAGSFAYVAAENAGLRVIEYYGAGIEETPNAERRMPNLGPTVVRGVLNLAGLEYNPDSPGGIGLCPAPVLLDATGRKVMELVPGENDVRHLAPGVYFLRQVSGLSACGHAQAGVMRNASGVHKVVIQK